jgi:pyrroloquinoline quinone biosynthesis protein D
MLYPEGIVTLNESAYQILKLCDGKNTVIEIKKELKLSFGDSMEIDNDIDEFINLFYTNNWIN